MKLIKYLTKITTPKGVDKGRKGTGVALHISDLKETNMEGRKIELLCTHSKQLETTTAGCFPRETPARKHHGRRVAVVTKSNKFFTAIITRQDCCWKQTYGSQGGVMR